MKDARGDQMKHSMHPQRLPRHLLSVAAPLCAALIAGCGGHSLAPGVVTVRHGSAASGASALTGASTHATARGAKTVNYAGPPPLAFAECMRGNGVPSFPDPAPGGGFVFPLNGTNLQAPAVQSAQARCRRFMPHPPTGSPAASSGRAVSQAMAQLRTVAECMRQHGISEFPDPQTTGPTNLDPSRYSNITNYEGAFLLFPSTINMQSPAWIQAAAACGPLAESFNHPHH